MIKAIIIDDEANALMTLNNDIRDYCPEVEVLDLCHLMLEFSREVFFLLSSHISPRSNFRLYCCYFEFDKWSDNVSLFDTFQFL